MTKILNLLNDKWFEIKFSILINFYYYYDLLIDKLKNIGK